MKNITISFMIFFAAAGLLFGIYQSYLGDEPVVDASLVKQNTNPHYPGLLRFRFAELPENLLARSGELTFEASELEGLALESLQTESEEILFALAYKQILALESEASVTIFRKKFSRPVSAILNQYGIPMNPNVELAFSQTGDPENYFRVGDQSFTREEIEKNSLLWHGIQSRLFRQKLRLAEEGLKKKAILKAAKKANQSLRSYRNEKIFEGQEFSTKEQKQRENYFLEKYVLDMPIETSLTPPRINLELKEEWTPSLGRKDSGLNVTIFGDFYSESSQTLIVGLQELHQIFPQVQFSFRPFFPRSDRYQLMVAEMAICLWSEDSQAFWEALPGLFTVRGDDFENKLFSAVEEKTKKMAAIKSCYLGRNHKDVIEYHLKTAEFWNVMSLPTALVGGEAFVGPTSVEVLRETIGRHLEVPTAGVWSPPEAP